LLPVLLCSWSYFASGSDRDAHGPGLVRVLGGGFAAIITPVHRDLDGLLRPPRGLAAVGRLAGLVRLIHGAFS
jgi:hypothetical protein